MRSSSGGYEAGRPSAVEIEAAATLAGSRGGSAHRCRSDIAYGGGCGKGGNGSSSGSSSRTGIGHEGSSGRSSSGSSSGNGYTS